VQSSTLPSNLSLCASAIFATTTFLGLLCFRQPLWQRVHCCLRGYLIADTPPSQASTNSFRFLDLTKKSWLSQSAGRKTAGKAAPDVPSLFTLTQDSSDYSTCFPVFPIVRARFLSVSWLSKLFSGQLRLCGHFRTNVCKELGLRLAAVD
jgi:hypothetical protein